MGLMYGVQEGRYSDVNEALPFLTLRHASASSDVHRTVFLDDADFTTVGLKIRT